MRVEWKSFLLRPRPEPRTLEAFRAYTRTWRRPAAEPDGGTFREWATDEGPPSHSVPPHLAAKAARTLGEPAFARLHERLLHAYFTENRDITARGTLLALWTDVGLPAAAFDRIDDPALLRAIVADHEEAVALRRHRRAVGAGGGRATPSSWAPIPSRSIAAGSSVFGPERFERALRVANRLPTIRCLQSPCA